MSEARTMFDGADDARQNPPLSGAARASLSVYADRDYQRAEMAEDAAAAGLRLAGAGPLGAASVDDGGDLLLLDCPLADDAARVDLAVLARLAARRGVPLVVCTSLDALDGVFASMPGREAQILVAPSRAERIIALARALPQAGGRVRELSEADRLALLRLTEQVEELARKLEQLSPLPAKAEAPAAAFRFEAENPATRGGDGSDRLVRATRPPLPDPRLVRRIIRQRQLRARFFDGDLFADPAWDMLLDLTAARAEHVRVAVTSLCIASGVPPTTALRWISQMSDAGLLQRVDDETDRRRAFITLTEKAVDGMARYFVELGPAASLVV